MIVARTIEGFCKAYGVGRSVAYELMRTKQIQTRKNGGRVLVVEESAKAWFESLPDARPERIAASAEGV